MENIKPLTPGGDIEQQWKVLKWKFTGYIDLDNTRAAWSEVRKVEALCHLIGPECQYLCENATQAQKGSLDAMYALIEENLKPQTNQCFERFKLKKMHRFPGEDVNLYLSRVRAQYAKCGYPAACPSDIFLIDAVVHDDIDITLQQLFFNTPNEELTVNKVTTVVQIHDSGKDQLQQIRSCTSRHPNPNVHHVHAVPESERQPTSSRRNSRSHSPRRSDQRQQPALLPIKRQAQSHHPPLDHHQERERTIASNAAAKVHQDATEPDHQLQAM